MGLLFRSHRDTDTESDGEDDDDDDEEAPPLQLAAVAGVLVGDLDLLITLLNVLNSVDGVRLGSLDDWFLLLDNSCKLLVKEGKLGERLLNALQLAMTGTHIAKDGTGMTGAVCSDLLFLSATFL
jgi:hypothetical protein